MNKEQIIDEVYNKWIKYSWNNRIYPNQNDKDIFIDRIKSEPDFSIHWGLKIEERELSGERRYNIWFNNNYETGMEKHFDPNKLPDFDNEYYEPTPTRLITITYKGTKIESYEY